jgi:hypothetical protein
LRCEWEYVEASIKKKTPRENYKLSEMEAGGRVSQTSAPAR